VVRDKETLILEDPKDKGSEPTTGSTDNSNTHFAILGLWAARRHDVPTDRSFALLVQRFQTSQGDNGTWAYNYTRGGANGPLQMTCVALLGLAIGHVLTPDPAVRPEKDPRVVSAFAALSPRIGEPAGRFDERPSIKDAGGLYFLWAMERIAVLYDVRQLDKKDWYRWGAEILIGHQSPDGSWSEDGGYHGQSPTLNTAFALMFLKRANLTPDLTRRLAVDTAALTAKVDTTVKPPAPTPKPMESTPVVVEPPPPPKEVPEPTRTEEKPAPTPTPAATTTPAPKEDSSGWIWIAMFVLVALVGGGLVVFGIQRSRANGVEEEERPRKKGVKKRVRAEED
jgi:cell division septation protein DedD